MDMIVAHDNAYGIGKQNQLAWDVPEDMRHFINKSKQYGVLVMGRNTLDSIGRPLPDREIHCLSSCDQSRYGEFRHSTVEELVNAVPEGALVVGGAAIYELFIDSVNVIWVTVIDTYIDGMDSFFPEYKLGFALDSVLEEGESKGMGNVNYRIEKWIRSV